MFALLGRMFIKPRRAPVADRGPSRDPDYFWFSCLRCENVYPAPETERGRKSACPHCGNVTLLPEAPAGETTAPCPLCGEAIAPTARACRHCGEFFGGAVPLTRESWARRLGRWVRRRPAPPAADVRLIAADRIEANPCQPRVYRDPTALRRLTASVRACGVIVPLIVRPLGRGRYQLVAGQRRLAAARAVGLKAVPAFVRPCTHREMIEVSTLENLHREEVSPVERAEAFERIHAEMPHLPASAVALRLGLDARAVASERKLLALPALLQEAVVQRMIEADRAQDLAGVPPNDLARKVECDARLERIRSFASAAAL